MNAIEPVEPIAHDNPIRMRLSHLAAIHDHRNLMVELPGLRCEWDDKETGDRLREDRRPDGFGYVRVETLNLRTGKTTVEVKLSDNMLGYTRRLDGAFLPGVY